MLQVQNSAKLLRFIGLLVTAGLIVWGITIYNNKDSQPKENSTVDTSSNSSAQSKSETSNSNVENSATAVGSVNDRRSFNYIPEEPVNGTKKGVVEVGASGFNSFVVLIDQQKHWKVLSKKFGESFVTEGQATTEDIRSGLKNYIKNMCEEHGVASKNIHFVVSSGALKDKKTPIIISELKKQGYIVNTVTPEEEGKFALKCVQPYAYKNSSFVSDIGSGNSKISWYQNNTLQAIETPGAKYYEKELKDTDVYKDVYEKTSKMALANREVCFIIGGVPFELAKEVRQGEERYTVLKNPKEYKTEKAKTLCGLNIYKSIQDATGCDTFVFDWDANFTIGFLLSLP